MRAGIADIQPLEQGLEVFGAQGGLDQPAEPAVGAGHAAAEGDQPFPGEARQQRLGDHQPGLRIGLLLEEIAAVGDHHIGQAGVRAGVEHHPAIGVDHPQAVLLGFGNGAHAAQQVAIGLGQIDLGAARDHRGVAIGGFADDHVGLFHGGGDVAFEHAGQVVGIAHGGGIVALARRQQLIPQDQNETAQHHGQGDGGENARQARQDQRIAATRRGMRRLQLIRPSLEDWLPHPGPPEVKYRRSRF